jgi:hypothetical protein
LPAGTLLLGYPDASLAYDFYLRRPVRELRGPDEVRAFLARPRAAALLTREENWVELRAGADAAWRPLLARTVAGRRMVVVGSH